MAIDMKTVKAITHNNKSLKNIKDSQGNIIWGNPTDYPYRRLEYIHLNGAEYIQTDIYAGTSGYNFICDFTVEDTPTGSDARTLFGIYDGSVTDALRRWYLIWRGPNGIRGSIGNSWSSYATAFSLNDKLRISMTYNKNGNTPRAYWHLNNITTGASIGSANPLNGTTEGDLNTNIYLKLGCQVNQSGNASNF